MKTRFERWIDEQIEKRTRLAGFIGLIICFAVPGVPIGAMAYVGAQREKARQELFAQTSGWSVVKSHVFGSGDGHYGGETNSHHKGGRYVNSNTGNHYRDRAHGVSY